MISFSFETITPAEATRILKEHDEAVLNHDIINRPRKAKAVRRYAQDISSGQWNPETAETIKFETMDKVLHGRRLVDGQNRLEACRVAGQNLRVYVARGVAREAFAYIDGGERRSLRDVLWIGGEPEAASLAPALNWLGQWDADQGRLIWKGSVSTQRARKLLESDPAIRKSVVKAKSVKESGLLSVGLAAFLHRIFSNHDPALADSFIDAIATGAGLAMSDPFLLLRQRLIDNKGSRKKHPQQDLIGLAVRAWNAKRQGTPMKLLRFVHGDEMKLWIPEDATREPTSSGPATTAQAELSS